MVENGLKGAKKRPKFEENDIFVTVPPAAVTECEGFFRAAALLAGSAGEVQCPL